MTLVHGFLLICSDPFLVLLFFNSRFIWCSLCVVCMHVCICDSFFTLSGSGSSSNAYTHTHTRSLSLARIFVAHINFIYRFSVRNCCCYCYIPSIVRTHPAQRFHSFFSPVTSIRSLYNHFLQLFFFGCFRFLCCCCCCYFRDIMLDSSNLFRSYSFLSGAIVASPHHFRPNVKYTTPGWECQTMDWRS